MVPKVLSPCFWISSRFFFKLIMKNNVASIMGPPYTMNIMTQLWRSLTSLQVITYKLLKYLKLAKITMVAKLLIMLKMKHVLIMWNSLTTNWQCTFKPCDSYVYSTILHIEKNFVPINSCTSDMWYWYMDLMHNFYFCI